MRRTRKSNAAMPVTDAEIVAMTSDVYTMGRMYDIADSILAQKISQVPGVGQVFVGGGASPAVRVEWTKRSRRASIALRSRARISNSSSTPKTSAT